MKIKLKKPTVLAGISFDAGEEIEITEAQRPLFADQLDAKPAKKKAAKNSPCD